MAQSALKEDKRRSAIQAKVVELIQKAGGNGILSIATGFGKAKVVIDYVKTLDNPKVLWVVPTVKTRDQTVPDEWNKWGDPKFFNSKVKVICYKSLHKETGDYDLIVLDEGHNITLRAYQAPTFQHRRYDKILMLTATLPTEKEKLAIIRDMNLNVIESVSVNEAVGMEMVAPFKVYVFPVKMNSITKDFKVATKNNAYFTTEQQRYSALQRQIDRFPLGKAPKQLYFARMRSIYNFKSKIDAALKVKERILQSDPGVRMLIFCGSIDAAEIMSSHTYHSKTDSSDYDAFNKKQINVLSVVNALNEGHNMVDVDIAMMVQVNSKERNYIQRQGRAIRWRKGHEAKIIIFYSSSTVDYKWVRSSLKSIDPKRIHWQKELT